MKRGITALLVLSAVVSGLLIGCSGSAPTGGGGLSGPTDFSYSVKGFPYKGDALWIFVDDDSHLRPGWARRVTQNGVVDFGNVGLTRLTVTLIWQRTGQAANIETYNNALAGAWYEDSYTDDDTSGAQGTADVRINLPAPHSGGAYGGLYIPSSNEQYFVPSSDCTQVHWSGSVYCLEDGNKFSAFAMLGTPGSQTCGWISDRPFTLHGNNAYTVDMNQPWQTMTVTPTRPLNDLSAVTYRGASMLRYYEVEGDVSTPYSINLKYAGFPATKYQLIGSFSAPDEEYWMDAYVTSLPANLTVPATTANSSFSDSLHAFTDAHINGTADCITAVWVDTLHTYRKWFVSTWSGVSQLTLPYIPDSILSATHMDTAAFRGYAVQCIDRDSDDDYDDYITRSFKTESHWPPAYTTQFFYSKRLATSVPLAESDSPFKRFAAHHR